MAPLLTFLLLMTSDKKIMGEHRTKGFGRIWGWAMVALLIGLHSDLTNSSFKCSNLENVKFDGASLTNAKIVKSNLRGASFQNCIFNHTDFNCSELSGVCFDNQTFNGTIFNNFGLKGTSFRNAVFKNVSFKTEVKKAIFDGAKMDKLTYAILKGYKANLTNVTII